ncbi:MAG TPA: J domain-containing protein [Rhodanobacteraceae bacterium]|jgi:hypothetical protein|nr:J domain-containing protein [Rhodanobacteraceae bacterium]
MITRTDIIVVVVCLLAGYFLVSWLIGRIQGGSARPAEPPPAPPPPGSGDGQSDYRRPPPPPSGSSTKPWYEVLQVPTYASLDDVKQAYRRRIAEYHPDKTSGLGEDLRALAEQKSREINAAYAAALKAFGKQ